MRILGVDPGTFRTGAGVIESASSKYHLLHFEVITVKASLPFAGRLHQIHLSLKEILHKFSPDVLALENVFFGKNPQNMVKLGEARACAMLAASERGIDVVEYPPARVKLSVSGNGQATKDQIQQMIKGLFHLEAAPPEDAADAIAVALCHLHHAKPEQILKFKSAADKSKIFRVVKY